VAAITFYLKAVKDSDNGSDHFTLQRGGSPPADTMLSTGWIVGTNAADRYARMDSAVERAVFTHTATVQPSGAPDNALGDCFRSDDRYTGDFAAGNWTFSFEIKGDSQATGVHDGLLRIRMWKSNDPIGAGAAEITAATQETSGYTDLLNSVIQTLTLVFDPGAISLDNEYIFVQVAHRITDAGNNSASDVHLHVGSNNSVISTDFTEELSIKVEQSGMYAEITQELLLVEQVGVYAETVDHQLHVEQVGMYVELIEVPVVGRSQVIVIG
jgi:hypothetical protein